MLTLVQINDNHKKFIGWVLRIFILGICARVIWGAVSDRWSLDFQFTNEQVALILLVAILMPVNWGLEVWRWKVSLDSIEKTPWGESSRQVFSSLALNWILPFTTGDLIARLAPNSDRKKVTLLVAYNRMVMLLLTMILGAYGMYRFSQTVLYSYKEIFFSV